MAEVLLNRNVPLIDEVAELIEQGGGPSLTSILDALRESMALQPGGLTEGQRNAAEQTAIRREILNYRFNTRSRRRRLLGGVRWRVPDLLR